MRSEFSYGAPAGTFSGMEQYRVVFRTGAEETIPAPAELVEEDTHFLFLSPDAVRAFEKCDVLLIEEESPGSGTAAFDGEAA